MNDPDTLVPISAVVRLGIRGLPPLTESMLSGGLYALVAETPPARFALYATSLASALQSGVVCSVIVPSNPELFIQRIESFGQFDVRAQITAERLQLFVMREEFQKNMFRYGSQRLAREMEQLDVPEGGFILFDQADEMLNLIDISIALDQVEALRLWFERRCSTAMMVFSRSNEVYADTINSLMDSFTGLVRLGADRNGLTLSFDYWQSPEGTIAARNYMLATRESGIYEATSHAAQAELASEGLEHLIDGEQEDSEQHFFYMDPDLGGLAKQLPGVWQRVDTLVGMMHVTRNTRSPTCILTFQRDTSVRQLAEGVHTLRLSLGRHARLVVQEKDASLRYQNEALLLRLGLNLVVHRDVPSSRLPLLLEALTGQVFTREVDINFEAALASVLPARLRGYILPPRFVREVSAVLERAQTLNIPCALVVGKPSHAMTPADILEKSNVLRPGDLISADEEYFYLFLNACPEAVLLNTLERIFGMPVEAMFHDVRFVIRREEIIPELDALSRAAERGETPDYSALVAVLNEMDVPSASPSALPPQTPSTPERHALVAPQPALEAVAEAPPQASATAGARHALPNFAARPSVPAAVRASSAVPAQAGPVRQPEAPAEPPPPAAPQLGVYGKKEAPRAMRSLSLRNASDSQRDDVSEPAGS